MSGLHLWSSALCQARLWAVPEAGSSLTERTLVHPGCWPWTQPPREEETGLPAGQAAHPRSDEPQNWSWPQIQVPSAWLLPVPGGPTSALPLHFLSLTGAPSADLCSLGFGVTPSLCDKPSRESFYYLTFNYYLGNGLELPRALLRRSCPRQTPSCGLMGCPSPAVLVVAGRRPVFEECRTLFPKACLSLTGDCCEAERPLCARRGRDWSPSALEGLVSVPGTPDSCVQLLRKL